MRILLLGICLGILATPATGNDESDARTWLKKFTGQWKSDSDYLKLESPEGSPSKSSGSIKSRTLGKYWVVSEWTTEAGDEKVTAIQTLGYDASKNQYVASWVDTVTSHMWTYEGKREGNKLVFHADGPSCFQAGKQAKYRETYEFVDEDRVVHTSEVLNGKRWVTYLKSRYVREKGPREVGRGG